MVVMVMLGFLGFFGYLVGVVNTRVVLCIPLYSVFVWYGVCNLSGIILVAPPPNYAKKSTRCSSISVVPEKILDLVKLKKKMFLT